MAHCDAAGMNGGNRIISHGAPPWRLMPNGWLGNPALVSLPVLTEASSWMAPGAADYPERFTSGSNARTRSGAAWIFSFPGRFDANRSLTLGRTRLYTAAFSKFDTNPDNYHFF